MRIGERNGRGLFSDDRVDELTPQDMILEDLRAASGEQDDEDVPTVRDGSQQAWRASESRAQRTLIPSPSRAGGDEALDFSSLMQEPLNLPSFQSIEFDATPMPTSANVAGSVAPVAMPLEDERAEDWIEEQLRRSIHQRARWPYALGAVGAVGIALVALSGWRPSWKQATSATAFAPAPLAAAVLPLPPPIYRAEDFPVFRDTEDPEVVYREIQQQLDQEARAATAEKAPGQEARAQRAHAGEAADENPYESSRILAAADTDSAPTIAGQTDPPPDAQPAEVQAPPFDSQAANVALDAAAASASACRAQGVPGGQVVRVAVTFAPSGRVNIAQITDGALLGTPTGSCVARGFYSARVAPFSGSMVTVHKTIRLE